MTAQDLDEKIGNGKMRAIIYCRNHFSFVIEGIPDKCQHCTRQCEEAADNGGAADQ